ncbi:galactokinase [Saccharomonospora cyanea]|uniref:Galactokinase n=1 Tax=Saccharomonospora cyanea NA-134 TaxID=882082 RepID=H5XI32_9PSEU|nr:galactokinase [Saccharomonospora cyanea]EHR60662.1 galactokinase [Saccharomonospora cyanea NA-134]
MTHEPTVPSRSSEVLPAVTAFTETFGRQPDGVWAAPGRVNVIGEHTDYNDGFVLPMALPQGVRAAAGRTPGAQVRVLSLQETGDPVTLELGTRPGEVAGWAAYVAGVVWSLRSAGHDVGGVDLVVDGDVPAGAGLSSSAALECAVAGALNDLFELGVEPTELARLAQRAENDFVGMPCGVMDQMASVNCREGHVLFLDTRSLLTEHVPFDPARHGRTLLVIDTRAPHRLVDGEYAKRRAACEAAAAALGVPALRDVALDDLPTALSRVDGEEQRRRVRHVVTENARVSDTVRRLRDGDLDGIGPLLTASHASLRDDYEVTVGELDTAVEAALSAGALGARMTGGGFGGCVIALVPDDRADTVFDAVRTAFADSGYTEPSAFTATPAPGARRIR